MNEQKKYEFEQFVNSLQGRGLLDILYAAEQEATRAERSAYKNPTNSRESHDSAGSRRRWSTRRMSAWTISSR